jgi:hypothetical protein
MKNRDIYSWPFRLEELRSDNSNEREEGVASIEEAKTVEGSSHLNTSVLSCPADADLTMKWFGPSTALRA